MKNIPHHVYQVLAGCAVLAAVAGAAFWYRSQTSVLPTDTMVVHAGIGMGPIVVSGSVQAAESVDLGFAQSGRISQIDVAAGDTVKKGALLASVDTGTVQASVEQSQAALETAQAQLAALQAGTRPEEIAVTQAQVSGDQDALLQAQQTVVNALQNAYTVSSDAISNKSDSALSNPQSSLPLLAFITTNSQSASTIASERVAIGQTLSSWRGEAAALTTASDLAAASAQAQANLASVASYLGDMNAALNSSVAGVIASQSAISGYIASVALARSAVNAAQTSLTAALAAQDSAEAALARDEKSLALEQAGATQDDVAAQSARVDAARAALASAEAALAQAQITAPFDGTVTRVDAKVGSIASPGNPQVSLISDGLFQIVSYIPEVEIAGVSVGDAASTTLDAYGPGVVFPASVIAIDPGNTLVNGVSTYKTTLQFKDADPRILSGMTASSAIAGQDISGAIAVPQGAVFSKNGGTVVQTLRSGTVVDVPVTLGVMPAVGDVEVLTGLRDGDVIVLSPDVSR